IFIARATAGLLLLYTALVIPVLFAAVWAARPGNLAMPFQMRMLEPALVDALTAGCFYFTGMLLTLRKARWLGTRLLPLLPPLLLTMALSELVRDARMAVVLIALVQAVCALAAWQAFVTAGAADRRGPSVIALGALLYAGAVVMGV